MFKSLGNFSLFTKIIHIWERQLFFKKATSNVYVKLCLIYPALKNTWLRGCTAFVVGFEQRTAYWEWYKKFPIH